MRPSVVTEGAPCEESASTRSGSEKVGGYDLDGLAVRRNDAHHTLIVEGFWIRLTPLEYQILLPLLKAYNRSVSTDALCWEAFASPRSSADDRRIYRHVDRMRPKLAPFGLVIRAVTQHGYMLQRDETMDTGPA